MTPRTTLAPALALALSALAVPMWPEDPEHAGHPNFPSIVVQGTGQAYEDPDEATVRLGVVAQATTARAAQEEANRVAAAILAAVRALGVEPQQVQTSQLSLQPLYAQDRPEGGGYTSPKITGYQASYAVSVRLEKLDLIGRVVDAGLAAGANQVEGVFFGLRNDQAARDRALQAAVRQARAKAQTIAAALEVRLGEPLEVVEGGFGVVTPMFDKRMALEMAASQAPTPISPGQTSVETSVTVRFRIAPP